MTLKEKRKYLESHGWVQLWCKDNCQGLSTEKAYEVEMESVTTDLIPEIKWGGKDTTYERLKERVKELYKKKK